MVRVASRIWLATPTMNLGLSTAAPPSHVWLPTLNGVDDYFSAIPAAAPGFAAHVGSVIHAVGHVLCVRARPLRRI